MPNKTGRPKGRKDSKPRGAPTKLDSELKAQRAAKARERVAAMSETRLLDIARRMQDAEKTGNLILTVSQWQTELRNGVME